jgi:predicted regulator of Ras-like GTPase activity (Roadblock/LC7/MglB family)
MVYQSLLSKLVDSVRGAQGAIMLDVGGEIVVETGGPDERLRLIGAYQGIALAAVKRTAERYGAGPIESLVSRYPWGTVILRPLKDEYYFVLALGPEGSVGLGLHRSLEAQASLNAEI